MSFLFKLLELISYATYAAGLYRHAMITIQQSPYKDKQQISQLDVGQFYCISPAGCRSRFSGTISKEVMRTNTASRCPSVVHSHANEQFQTHAACDRPIRLVLTAVNLRLRNWALTNVYECVKQHVNNL